MATVNKRWVKLPVPYAAGGWTTQNVKDGIDAALAAYTDTPVYIIINLGANDVSGGDPGVTWKNNTDYIVDACHTKYPGAIVYLTKIWRRNTGSQAANIALINTSIDELVADANHASWLRVGVNEGDFLPGGDDGVTNTSDGVHPNAAGCTLWAAAMKAVLGI
jgi:lysophospholipase L1-like esterase